MGIVQAAWRHAAPGQPARRRHHRHRHPAAQAARRPPHHRRPPSEKSHDPAYRTVRVAPAKPPRRPFRERRGLPAAPPIRLAHIVSVSGSHAVAVLERQDARGQRGARPDRRPDQGRHADLRRRWAWSPPSARPCRPPKASPSRMGLIEINLAGEVVPDGSRRLTFRRGVSSLPTLGDAVLLADKHDLTRVYAPPQAASIKIGSLFQEHSVPARLLVDDLLAKHFLVVGSTGSGKSSRRDLHPAAPAGRTQPRPCGDPGHPQRIFRRLWRPGRAHQPGQFQPAVLDAGFPGNVRGAGQRDAHHDAEVEILSRSAWCIAKTRYSECRHRPRRRAAQRPTATCRDHRGHAHARSACRTSSPGSTNSWASWSAPSPCCPIAA